MDEPVMDESWSIHDDLRALKTYILVALNFMPAEERSQVETAIRGASDDNSKWLEAIPPEIWRHIIPNSSPETLVHLSRVNKKLYALVKDLPAYKSAGDSRKFTTIDEGFDGWTGDYYSKESSDQSKIKIVSTQKSLNEVLQSSLYNFDEIQIMAGEESEFTLGGFFSESSKNRATINAIGAVRVTVKSDMKLRAKEGAHAICAGGEVTALAGSHVTVNGGWATVEEDGYADVYGGKTHAAKGSHVTVHSGEVTAYEGAYVIVNGGTVNDYTGGTYITLNGGTLKDHEGTYLTINAGVVFEVTKKCHVTVNSGGRALVRSDAHVKVTQNGRADAYTGAHHVTVESGGYAKAHSGSRVTVGFDGRAKAEDGSHVTVTEGGRAWATTGSHATVDVGGLVEASAGATVIVRGEPITVVNRRVHVQDTVTVTGPDNGPVPPGVHLLDESGDPLDLSPHGND